MATKRLIGRAFVMQQERRFVIAVGDPLERRYRNSNKRWVMRCGDAEPFWTSRSAIDELVRLRGYK